jgi:hypothetical protein
MKGMILLTCGGQTEGLKIIGKYDPEQQAEAMREAELLTQQESKPHHLWTFYGVCRPKVAHEWEGIDREA